MNDVEPADSVYRDMFHPRTGLRIRNRAEYIDAFEGPRHIGATILRWKKHQVWISTVHLVFDHGFGDSGAPVLFETMIFGDTHKLPGPADIGEMWADFQMRYSWEDDAIAGHNEIVKMLTKMLVVAHHTVVTVPDRNTPIIRTEITE